MKIAILVGLFPPKWLAGTEIATYYVAEHLTRCGHEVHVITSLDEGLSEESYEKGFCIHRLPRARIRFLGRLLFWVNVVRTLRNIDPDITHVQSLNDAVPAVITKKLSGTPYAVWGQGSDIYLPNWFTKLTAKMILKRADSVIALTKDMERTMQVIYNRNITVVPNGINFEEYVRKPMARNGEIPEKKILFVGRLHPVKGVRYLLYAMKIVHEEMPEAKLILVGDGEERDNLKDLTDSLGIRECVNFVGKVPHERIPDYMHQADIFVLSSLSESFGLVNLEAMACGLPIVATRVGGLPDIIEEGVNGYLVEAEDYREMADNILDLLQNPLLSSTISENNRRKVLAYTWENVIDRLECIYLEAIRHQRQC